MARVESEGSLCDGFVKEKIQMRFLKYTALQMKFKLLDNKDKRLNEFIVDAKDRTYQFWKRNSLSIDLWTEEVFLQKLNYIHSNPIKHPWYLSKLPEEYKYSSAKFKKLGLMSLVFYHIIVDQRFCIGTIFVGDNTNKGEKVFYRNMDMNNIKRILICFTC